MFLRVQRQEQQELKFKKLFLERESSSSSSKSPSPARAHAEAADSAPAVEEPILFSLVENPYINESVISQLEEEDGLREGKDIDQELINIEIPPEFVDLTGEEKESKTPKSQKEEVEMEIEMEMDAANQEEEEDLKAKVEFEAVEPEEGAEIAKDEEEPEESEPAKEQAHEQVPELPELEDLMKPEAVVVGVQEAPLPAAEAEAEGEGEGVKEEKVEQVEEEEEEEKEEKIPEKYYDPGKEAGAEGAVGEIRSGWQKFASFVSESIFKQKKYRWGPFAMAAIMKQVDLSASLMEAEEKRFEIAEPLMAFPSTIHQHRVRVINLSEYTWPGEVWVDMLRGDKKIKFRRQRIQLQLRPMEESSLSLCFTAPKTPGLFAATFALRGLFNKKELCFGELIEVEVRVQKRSPEDLMVKQMVDAEQLHAEGLADYEDCLRALRVSRNDLGHARDLLLARQDEWP